MDPAILARHAALTKEIEQANFEYHAAAGSTLSDAEYDVKVRQLKEIEDAHPELAKNSPLKQVGAAAGGPKVKHARKMLSLDNVFTPEEATNHFKTPADKIWEPKIDGCSLSLVYVKGRLARGTTRGNGTEGDDVTRNVLVIPTIPKFIKFAPDNFEVRGEVCIFRDDFAALLEELKRDGEEPFANARNAASGSLKLSDSAESAKRKLSFVAYQSFGSGVRNHVEMIGELQGWGFSTPNRWTRGPLVPFRNITQELADQMDAERRLMPFDTDGAVIKINDFKIRQEMGDGSKSPKWAVAYKFAPEEGISVLEAVELPIGRTGVITPVAILSPVLLSGATVRRASLCNWDEIARLDIAVGDEVVVVRAAEVIPKVIRVHKKSATRKEIAMPTVCPACGGPIKIDSEVVAIRCVNIDCNEQVFQRLSHAVNKTSLDWDGCGDAQIVTLMASGKCRNLSDFFALTNVEFLGVAAKSRFLAERERVKNVPLWRKFHALGLEGIGKTFCQELAVKYGDLLKMLDDRAGVAVVVGPNRAEKVFARIDQLADELGRLDELGFKFVEVKTDRRATEATGKQFVITGTLTTGSRDAVAERIEQAGGLVKSSVSAKTDYLVVGDNPGGGKTSGAKKHGTKVISEDELYKVLGIDPSALPDDPLANVNIDDL